MMNFVFSPINGVKTDIALIRSDINTIQLNHEAHMQTALQEIADLKRSDVEMDQRLEKQNEAIIRLLTIHPELK